MGRWLKRVKNRDSDETRPVSIRPSPRVVHHKTGTAWPQKCLESERRFGHKEARLYPLINKRVMTPRGPGRLWRVFAGSIGVVLDTSPNQITDFVLPDQIFPLGNQVVRARPRGPGQQLLGGGSVAPRHPNKKSLTSGGQSLLWGPI